MIEAVKIEDFVIEQVFMPYSPSITGTYDGNTPTDEFKKYKSMLRKNPEKIIEILDGMPETKRRVFNRLQMFGGVKWYRYLDMSNPVIRWVNKNLEEGNG